MRWFLLTFLLLLAGNAAADVDPEQFLDRLAELPYVERVEEQRGQAVRAHLIALGAMSKIHSVWSPRESERRSGSLSRFTWRVYDAVPSSRVLADIEHDLPRDFEPQLLFSCEARACGSSAQWANRIFNQRVLYGTASSQEYRAYSLTYDGKDYRLLLYASSRTADRQYLHTELLELDQPD